MSSSKKLILRIIGSLIIILLVALVSYEYGERHTRVVYAPTLVRPAHCNRHAVTEICKFFESKR